MDPDFSEQRTKMVDGQLRTTDVTSAAILDAMGAVPRERFVPPGRRAVAYIDEDVRLSPGNRYLMEPSPFAKLLQLAAIEAGDTVLDVGGTGYSAAVLSRLARQVVLLESDAGLAAEAAGALADLGCANVSVVTGALAAGHASAGPYDVIVIGGSVEEVPPALLAQLAEGGRLVAVEGHGNAGRARIYLKRDEVVTGRSAFNAAIKPLPGFEAARAFEF